MHRRGNFCWDGQGAVMRKQPHKDRGKDISRWKKQQVQSPVKGITFEVLQGQKEDQHG